MAEFPALPLWTDAYLADTRHLTTLEHGAYMLLMMEAWRRPGCNLPDDDDLLARLVGLGAEAWASAKPVVMGFWKIDRRSRCWSQKRLKKERDYVGKKSRSQSDKATKRWKDAKNKDAAALPRHSRGNAPTPTIPIPNGIGRDAPPDDPKKAVFDAGVALLVGAGLKDRTARSQIAKWCKNRGDAWTREAILSAEGKADPVAWIERRGAAAKEVEDEARQISADRAARYRRMEIPGPPPSTEKVRT